MLLNAIYKEWYKTLHCILVWVCVCSISNCSSLSSISRSAYVNISILISHPNQFILTLAESSHMHTFSHPYSWLFSLRKFIAFYLFRFLIIAHTFPNQTKSNSFELPRIPFFSFPRQDTEMRIQQWSYFVNTLWFIWESQQRARFICAHVHTYTEQHYSYFPNWKLAFGIFRRLLEIFRKFCIGILEFRNTKYRTHFGRNRKKIIWNFRQIYQ